jgi:Na+-translocating ferredoxin:NAD+ oxidoreductase subunit A
MDFFAILLGMVLVNNFVLVQFLGLCPFMGVSNQTSSALGMGAATTFVLTLASLCCYLVDHWVLLPLHIPFLRTICFIVVIAAVVQFAKLFIEKFSPLLYRVLGVYLPLITTNCAVLGLCLQNATKTMSFFQAGVYGLGAGLGFSLVLVCFSAMRERLVHADAPRAFKGSALAMITAGLMSLAFMGFAGLV